MLKQTILLSEKCKQGAHIMTNLNELCELCGRSKLDTTVHHLTPREEGGKYMETAILCIACHKMVHALYTNKELAIRLNSLEALKEDEKVAGFIKWVQKQSPGADIKVHKSREVRSKKKHKY